MSEQTNGNDVALRWAKDIRALHMAYKAMANGQRKRVKRGDRWLDNPEDLVRYCRDIPRVILVRSGWHEVGDVQRAIVPREYMIVLCRDQFASHVLWELQIVGELDEKGWPETASFQWAGYGEIGHPVIRAKPNEDADTKSIRDAILWYASLFNYTAHEERE